MNLPVEAPAAKAENPVPSPLVHELFAAVAARRGTARAVVSGDFVWTYAELNARANRIARAIAATGVAPGALVAVCLPRSPDLIASLLGILKAGCAYVPLDASYPTARVAYMLRDTAARLLVTNAALVPQLTPALAQAGNPRVLCLDRDTAQIALFADHDLPPVSLPPPDAAPLAYVLYTSGSTGVPKGVLVPHRGIVRLVVGARYTRFAADEVFLQLAPISFDASTFEIWGSLLNGACLALAPAGLLSLEAIGAAIAQYGVTTLWLTAGLFHAVVDANIEMLRPLRQLLAGGDALSPRHVRRAVEALPGCTFINGYGPTETTTFACCHTVTPADLDGAPIPIGKPIARTTIHVCDAALQALPHGVAGEIVIGGDGVALGYRNQPALTAERFVVLASGEAVYRTGDRGRRRADGVLEFLGRMDDQVKIAGHRIEPREIESCLASLPGVAQAAAVTRAGSGGELHIAAYAVLCNGAPLTPEALRAQLAARLPAYLMPASLQVLAALPLSANGKLDRTQLPAPAAAVRLGAAWPPQIADPLAESVRAAWARALGIEQLPGSAAFFDLGGNFFDLGGSSLRLLGLHAELERVCGHPIPITALFEHTTLGAVTAYLRGEGASSTAACVDAERARHQKQARSRARAAHAGKAVTP